MAQPNVPVSKTGYLVLLSWVEMFTQVILAAFANTPTPVHFCNPMNRVLLWVFLFEKLNRVAHK
jgi:hypothetical protein